MSARDQVFAITELLEAVLLQLPMETLFLAQEVCKHWLLLIITSDPIQKVLFMRPSINAADAAIDAICCTHTLSDGRKIQVDINPNLCRGKTYYPSSKSKSSPPPPPCPRTFTFHEAAIYSRNRDWLYPDTMYVTSPPIPLTLFISYDCDAEDGRFTVVGSDPGDDFDKVREAFFDWGTAGLSAA
ncbi:hypothetical protein KC349_g7713 [Hortaea werneckii]|nr:hypothetical protein KC349_g7713 [Hortaea werneckii]